MTVTHDAVAAIRQLQVLPLGDEGVGFSNQHLGQHPPSAFTRNLAQWIVDGIRLTERDDGGISRHGVSLLSGGSGRLDTRLDTPPSIKRRHPDSRLALAFNINAPECLVRKEPEPSQSTEENSKSPSLNSTLGCLKVVDTFRFCGRRPCDE